MRWTKYLTSFIDGAKKRIYRFSSSDPGGYDEHPYITGFSRDQFNTTAESFGLLGLTFWCEDYGKLKFEFDSFDFVKFFATGENAMIFHHYLFYQDVTPDLSSIDNNFFKGDFFSNFFYFKRNYSEAISESLAHRMVRLKTPWLLNFGSNFAHAANTTRYGIKKTAFSLFESSRSIYLTISELVRYRFFGEFLGTVYDYTSRLFDGDRNLVDYASLAMGIAGMAYSTRYVSRTGLKYHLGGLLLLVSGLLGMADIVSKSPFVSFVQDGIIRQADEDDDEAFNFVDTVYSYLSKLCEVPSGMAKAIKDITTSKHNKVKEKFRDLITYSKMLVVFAGPGIFDNVEKWLFGSYLLLLMELDAVHKGPDWMNYMQMEASRKNFKTCLEVCHVYFNASSWDVGPKETRDVVLKHRKLIVELRKSLTSLPPVITKNRFETIGIFLSGQSGMAKSGLFVPALRNIVEHARGSSGLHSAYPTSGDWAAAVAAIFLNWDDCQSTYLDLQPEEASKMAQLLIVLLSTDNMQPDCDRIETKGAQTKAELLCMTSNRPYNKSAFVDPSAITSRIAEYVLFPNAILTGKGPDKFDHESWANGEYHLPGNDPMLTFMFDYLTEHFPNDRHFLMKGFVEIFRSGERSKDYDPSAFNPSTGIYSFRNPVKGRATKYYIPDKSGYTGSFTTERGEFVSEFVHSKTSFRDILASRKYDSLSINALMGVISTVAYCFVLPSVESNMATNAYVIVKDVLEKHKIRKERYEKSMLEDPSGILFVAQTDVSDSEIDVASLAKRGARAVTKPKVACALLFVLSCLCLYYYMRPSETRPESQSFNYGNGYGRMHKKKHAIYQQGQAQSDEAQSFLKNVVHIGTANKTLAKGLVVKPHSTRNTDGHVVAMTLHSYDTLKRVMSSKLYFSRASAPNVKFNFNIGPDGWMFPIKIEEDADVVYIFISANVMNVTFKDLSHRVYPRDTPLSDVELTYHDREGYTSYVTGTAVPSKNFHNNDICIRSNNNDEHHYDASKIFCVDLPIETMTGMCGTAAVSTDAGPRIGHIIGIHIGGDGKRAYYARLPSLDDLERTTTDEPKPVAQGEVLEDDIFQLDAFDKGPSDFPIRMQPTSFTYGYMHHFISPSPSKTKPTSKDDLAADFNAFLPSYISDYTSDDPLKYPSGAGFANTPYIEMGRRIVLSQVNVFSIDPIAGSSAYDDLVHVHKFNSAEQFILSYKEAIFGSTVPGSKLSHLDKVDHSTSPGPTLQKEYTSKCRRSDFLLNRDNTGFISPGKHMVDFIIDHVNVTERSLIDGSYTYSVVANWKNELLPYGKNPRAFYVGDLADLVVVRRLFGSSLDHILRNRIHNGSAIGANCFGSDWSYIHDRLRGKFCTDLDISKMEYRAYNKDISDYVVRFFTDFYDGSPNDYALTTFSGDKRKEHLGSACEMRVNFLRSIVKPFLHYRGRIYQGMDFNPSGHPLTAVLNTLVLQFHYRHAYYSLCARSGLHDWNWPFNKYVKDICMGDDCIMTVDKDVMEWFNPVALKDFMAELNITITAADKKEDLAFKPLKNCTFLKREFFLDSHGILQARLAMDTLVNLMVWGVKKPVRERKAAVVDAILVEASIWGPEVFKWYFRCLRLSLGYTKEFGIKVASYEAYLARMAGNDRV